jgi:hypothetical protein
MVQIGVDDLLTDQVDDGLDVLGLLFLILGFV